VPDLRYTNASMHQMFQQVVLSGALRQFGMPSFSEDLTSPQVRSIEGLYSEPSTGISTGRRGEALRTSSLDLGEIPIRRLSDRDFYGQSAGKASRGTRHSSSPGKVGSDGRIELPVTIPEDLVGCTHLSCAVAIASSLARSLRLKPVSSASDCGGPTRRAPDRLVSRNLPGSLELAAAVVSAPAAYLRRRPSRQQDSSAAFHV